jgi:hypothetical protein
LRQRLDIKDSDPHIATITGNYRKNPVTERRLALSLARWRRHMDNGYWIGRKRSAMRMARGAATAEVRLIHYDLAGRYSIRAAQFAPLALPPSQPARDGEGARSHLAPPDAGPAFPLRPPREGERP